MVAAYLGIKPRYRDPDELADPVAETERWMRIEEECAMQDLSGLLGALR
jgi:hypothetical protein